MEHDWEYDGYDAHKGKQWWYCKNCNERDWWNDGPPDEMFNGGCKKAPILKLELLDAKLEKIEKLLKEALEILVK